MEKWIVFFVLLLVPCSTMSQVYIINLTSAETTMNITSPNYPTKYGNNVDIEWQLIAPTGFRVMVQFNDFDLEQGDNGTYCDILRIHHGLTNSLEEATLRASLSGSSLPDNFSSIGSYLWIRFTSDGRGTKKGFSLSVSAVKPDWACDLKEDSCGLKNDEKGWAIGKLGNYYFIRAIQDVSSFTIPHAYTSRKGTLSFAYFLSERGSLVVLNVTVCKSQEPFPLGNRGNIKYDYITYSCHGIQDVEIIFTAIKDNNLTWITVHDIQLYETSIPSTTSSSTITMHTTPLQTTTLESTQSEISSKGPALVGTSLSLVPILSSTLASLSAIAIIVLIVCLVCRQKRLERGSSKRNAAFEEPREGHGMRDNPTFESSNVHDLRKSDVAECHDRNDPYIALTTPHGGSTFQVYEPLREVNSQGDGYEVPVNRANVQTGSEFHVRHETDYETTNEYEDPDKVGITIPQCKSHRNGLQEMSKTDHVTTPECEYVNV